MLLEVSHFIIHVSNEKLGIAFYKLTEKRHNTILMRYFLCMNDREISELYHVSRYAIYSRRSKGLKKSKKLLSEWN